jgi:hypothetical protein
MSTNTFLSTTASVIVELLYLIHFGKQVAYTLTKNKGCL